jgi:hypothetical protein
MVQWFRAEYWTKKGHDRYTKLDKRNGGIHNVN